MSSPKAHKEEPHEPSPGTHRGATQTHPENQNIHFSNKKTNKSEFGEERMTPPKAHTEEPRRHIQKFKILTVSIRKQTKVNSGKGA